MSADLYETDFYARANEQAALLRAGKLSAADIGHIAEEIESMGRGEKREPVNRLAALLLHLLKWRFQPALHGNSWRLSIEEQRYRLSDHPGDNPSLRARLGEAITGAYRLALVEAERETGLARTTFPTICPWAVEEMMDHGFGPERMRDHGRATHHPPHVRPGLTARTRGGDHPPRLRIQAAVAASMVFLWLMNHSGTTSRT
ncbi:DUF29 family protein [Azospirillum halopraeferens]|uniref:DUF29 family protein n=1 Tax=Azospirillum halopraeferens TaxID=34010 RepID=UPI00048FA701